MVKFNANILGIGDFGIKSINAIKKSGMTDYRTVSVKGADCHIMSYADYMFSTKEDFVNGSSSLFSHTNTMFAIIADMTKPHDISIAYELSAIVKKLNAFTIFIAYMPSSLSPTYEKAKENLEEMHDIADGVVRFNQGYTPNFCKDLLYFLSTISYSMSTNGLSPLIGFDSIKQLLTQNNDIYYVYVHSNEIMDSHLYNAKSLCMKLCSQMYLDVAKEVNYFYSSAKGVNKNVLNTYITPINELNITFMSDHSVYVSDNNMEMTGDEFLFAILCSE